MAFPFYNTASPSPSTKNSINKTAVTYGIRDFLLNRNLAPVYPQIPTSINGSPRIGEPVLDTGINQNTNVFPIGLPLEVEGLLRYDLAIIQNKFKNEDINAPQLLSVENITTTKGIFGDIDFPQGIESYPRTSNDDITNFGLLAKTNYAGFRDQLTLYNLYVDTDSQIDVSDWISLQPMGVPQQLPNYLSQYGIINNGVFGAVEASDILGSSLNTINLSAGLNLGGSSIGFDFRASLSSRTLGSSSPITDTNLGYIASQQLSFELANNAGFNTPTEYSITVPTGGIINAGAINAILGYNLPVSYLNDAGSIFTSEYSSGNIERANSMLLNTGLGQISALLGNMDANLNGSGQYDSPKKTIFRRGYAPGYKDSSGNTLINPYIYAFYTTDGASVYNFVTPNNTNGAIPEISYNRVEMVKGYGFLAPEDTHSGPVGNSGYDNRKISDVGFTWTTSHGGLVNSSDVASELPTGSKDVKSLLSKTQLLFNSKGMKNIVSTKGEMNKTSSQIETANGGGISHGSAVLSAAHFNDQGFYIKNLSGATETFCRSWTTLDRYDQVSKLVRHSSLSDVSKIVPYRFQTLNSSLEEGGFVKIAPYTSDKLDPNQSVVDLKNYMFSIENLAWNDMVGNLPPVEFGQGDLTTGKKGRIMWFPPYNIQFNETSNVNWESTNFIGRGEPVYTYNNTERSGTLSFTIIVDHPSYANAFRNPNGPDDSYVAAFFAGCVDPTSNFAKKLTVSQISTINQAQTVTPQQANITSEPPPQNLTVYFPNDVYDFSFPNYEDGSGAGIGTYMGELTPASSNIGYVDRFNNNLNQATIDGSTTYNGIMNTGSSYWSDLKTYLTNICPHCTVSIAGYASPQGIAAVNTQLALDRATTIYNFFKDNIFGGSITRLTPVTSKALTGTACIVGSGADTDTIACKNDRKAVVTFQFNSNLAQQTVAPAQPQQSNSNQTNTTVNTQIINRLYNEAAYFDRLTEADSFVFDRFRNKIKYFHPAFHSMTPEGLNSRLTFLQQCTRQGPTLESIDADNLAFGRPPVCILRVGDFYNTKIVIDNINFDYEPIIWDLNPEGIGVQPMLANVNMSFKFLGGSSLMGPINKLQNALSFNYYANTHVYDPRADYIAKTQTTPTTSNGNSKPTLNLTTGQQYDVYNDTNNGSLTAFTSTNSSQSNTSSQASTNQTAAAAQASSGAGGPAIAPPNTTDKDRIKYVGGHGVYGGVLNLVIEIIGSAPLSKDQDFSVVLAIDSKVIPIATSTLIANEGDQTFYIDLHTTSSGDITPQLQAPKSYQLIVKFGFGNVVGGFTYFS